MRVQRDIPTYVTSSGVDRTNLRQYVQEICRQKNIKCRCIRCREAGFNTINKKINLKNIKIKIMEYNASKGKEFFIAVEEPKNDILFGYFVLLSLTMILNLLYLLFVLSNRSNTVDS